ncbi:MAG: glycosyltransferase family 39 protein, partial [Methanobacterium sp.]
MSEFSIRFLSVIFGFFAILMIYMVGTLIFNKNGGIISSLILALSAFHIYYSQEARMYSLMTLLTLLSIYFFIKLINGGNFKFIIGYILSSILLMYTHYFGLVIIITQNIYFFTMFLFKLENKFNLKRWILLQIILVFLYIPWVNFVITAMSAFTNHVTWVERP